MAHVRSPALIATLLLAVLGGPASQLAAVGSTEVSPGSEVASTATDNGPAITETAVIFTTSATRQEGEMVRWAVRRFELAGLELPSLGVAFHDGTEACRGFIGLYSVSNQRIEICNRGGQKTDPTNTVLHELAHAWSFTQLDGDEIAEFVGHRDLESWNSRDLAWWQRGEEQAAEIVAWGLLGTNEYRSIWIHTEPCKDLATAFELITGSPPLNTNTRYCK